MGSSNTKQGNNAPVAVAKEHRDSVNCMVISDDGSFIVSGSEDCTARVWSTQLDQVESLYVLEGHVSYLTCVAIMDNSIFTGSADKTIRKWDLTSGACQFVYKGHVSRLTKLAVTDKFLFSGSTDGYTKVWLVDPKMLRSERGEEPNPCIRTLTGHQKGVSDVLFLEAEELPGDEENNVFIKPGDFVITSSLDSTAICWSLDTGKPLKKYRGHTGPITCLCSNEDKDVLYTASQDKTIRAWCIKTGKCNQIYTGHSNTILHLALSRALLYSGAADGTARSWVVEYGEAAREFRGHDHTITSMVLNGDVLYTACGDGAIRAFGAKDGSLKKVFKGHCGSVTCIVTDDERLYSAGSDGSIQVWDITQLSNQVGKIHRDKTGSQVLREEVQARRLAQLERKLSFFQQEGQLTSRKVSSPSELSQEVISEE